MIPIHLNCTTISDAWFQAIYNIWDNHYVQKIQRGSFENTQQRLQYAGFSCYISHPWDDMIPIVSPALGIPSPIGDGTIDDGMRVNEDYFANYLMNPELAENETYRYASRIHKEIPETTLVEGNLVERYTYGKNVSSSSKLPFIDSTKLMTPIKAVIDMLKVTPLTNHAVIEIAQPKDITCCVGKDGKNDPPCLRLIDFKVIPCDKNPETDCNNISTGGVVCEHCRWEYSLSVSVYFRSWDLWAGFPVNLGGIELLKQYVAQECGLNNGAMYAYSAGLHLYKYQEELAKIRTMKGGKE